MRGNTKIYTSNQEQEHPKPLTVEVGQQADQSSISRRFGNSSIVINLIVGHTNFVDRLADKIDTLGVHINELNLKD